MSLFGRFLRNAARNLELAPHTSERLDLSVPTNKVDVVRPALEQWLQGYGVSSPVTVRSQDGDDTRLSVELDESESELVDFKDKSVQTDLEDVLFKALK